MTELVSRRDVDFLLHEWLEVVSLTERKRFAEHALDTFDAVLDVCTDVAIKYFAPHNKTSDANEPTIRADGTAAVIDDVKTALDVYASVGMLAADFDEAVGGMQLPTTVARAANLWFQAANVATANYSFLTIAGARLICAYGTDQHISDYVRPMLEGRYFGTMCLSEPQAGSSLADITTRAVRQDDGTYRISGRKMWISGGDHELSENIVHLVLAKCPGGPLGVRGISLFIVPKYLAGQEDSSTAGERNDIALMGLNHKMGQRGTTNALLAFGDAVHAPGGNHGAVGYLLGEEHLGLSYIFHMMNEARIGVGFGAAALGYAGYLKSVEYAKVRTQGRLPGTKDPATSPVPLIEHADIRRMLLAQKSYVEGALALLLFCSRLVDEQATADDETAVTEAGLLLDILTPIAKSWPARWCLEANSLAIQVHGGYGYTRDYDVEQHYRDNRLNPIHEGTDGVQGLDLLGRKVRMNDGAGLKLLGSRIGGTIARAASLGGDSATFAAQLGPVWARVVEVTGELVSAEDPATGLANSTIYLEALGHTVIAWIWLEQLAAVAGRHSEAKGADEAFYQGKRQAARYFYIYELPKVAAQLDLLSRLDRTTLEMDPTWF